MRLTLGQAKLKIRKLAPVLVFEELRTLMYPDLAETQKWDDDLVITVANIMLLSRHVESKSGKLSTFLLHDWITHKYASPGFVKQFKEHLKNKYGAPEVEVSQEVLVQVLWEMCEAIHKGGNISSVMWFL